MTHDISKKVAHFFGGYPVHKLQKHTLITLAGEEPTHVTYLMDGIVEQYHITPQGNKVVVNVFKPPAFFPMSWAINKTPNSYFYETLTESTITQVSAPETIHFLKENPDVTFDLLSRVYRGTDSILKRMILASGGIAVNRIVFELLVEAFRFGTEIESDTRKVTIKQHILAARSGLARETVSRELRKLSDGGYISYDKNSFTISISKLEKLLDINI